MPPTPHRHSPQTQRPHNLRRHLRHAPMALLSHFHFPSKNRPPSPLGRHRPFPSPSRLGPASFRARPKQRLFQQDYRARRAHRLGRRQARARRRAVDLWEYACRRLSVIASGGNDSAAHARRILAGARWWDADTGISEAAGDHGRGY